MKCLKCEHEMKPYVGLVETGWDCVNPNCGKDGNFTIKELTGTSTHPYGKLKSEDFIAPPGLWAYPVKYTWVDPDNNVTADDKEIKLTIPSAPHVLVVDDCSEDFIYINGEILSFKEMNDGLNKLIKDLYDSFQLTAYFNWFDGLGYTHKVKERRNNEIL